MNIVFFGTPSFACASLQAIIDSRHKVVAVVTQPDKVAGRGKKLEQSAVKLLAVKHGIPVYQFNKIRKEGVETLKSLDADIFVTCAYGQILSADILFMKKHGVINIHASLLPKYRGSSPIQWAIINGEQVSGITILKSDIGIDDGDIILKNEIALSECETSETLFEKLSHAGAETVLDALNQIENGTATYIKQDHEQATHCKMIKKEMAHLNMCQPVKTVVGYINGLNVWPCVSVKLNDMQLKLYAAKPALVNDELYKNKLQEYKCGEVVIASAKQGLVIKVLDGYVELLEVQNQNSKKMSAKSFLNGKKIEVGSIINE